MKTVLLTFMKDWYYLTFFPQEDVNQLTQLKSSLTPFLKSIEKALSFELENDFVDVTGNWDLMEKMKESIINEILSNIPTQNSTSNSVIPSTQSPDTLKMEFDRLLTLQ